MFGLVKNYGYVVKKAGLYDQGNHAALELIKGENAPSQVESKENLPGITTAMAELPYINPKYFSYPRNLQDSPVLLKLTAIFFYEFFFDNVIYIDFFLPPPPV